MQCRFCNRIVIYLISFLKDFIAVPNIDCMQGSYCFVRICSESAPTYVYICMYVCIVAFIVLL